MRDRLIHAGQRMKERLCNSSGESLPEVLIGMLIACMATVALVAMTLSASSTAQKSREAYEDVCDQESAIALSTQDEAGASGDVTAVLGSGNVSISLGAVSKTLGTKTYRTSDLSYYEVASADKSTSSDTLKSGGE